MDNRNKYDLYLSKERDFEDSPNGPQTRYIICSSPRTGSTLLGQMLKDLSRFLHYVIHQDEAWQKYLNGKGKPCLTVFYEDLTQNWERSSRDILNFITTYAEEIPPHGHTASAARKRPIERKIQKIP